MNPLSGLIGQYSDSDDSDEEMSTSSKMKSNLHPQPPEDRTVHPPPVQHCPWSACYDEGSGCTYYWNQITNEVTWEAPQEYLMALKLVQQHMISTGSAEVSAEEWQLYQQALAEKQKAKTTNTMSQAKPQITDKNNEKAKNGKPCTKKRRSSDSDNEKIELITSYSHSDDSESNDESESPVKTPVIPKTPVTSVPMVPKVSKHPHKKHKTAKVKEFGPSLPENINYTVPIGPDLPPEFMVAEPVAEVKAADSGTVERKSSPKVSENDDEESLFKKLRDKAKILEKLGGELPEELESLIKDESNSRGLSPAKIADENSCDSRKTDIDDLLDEIEKKELPKIKNKVSVDMFNENTNDIESEVTSSPKPLFPSSKAILEETPKSLFPSAVNIDEASLKTEDKTELTKAPEKKGSNIYMSDHSEAVTNKKKLRLSNSVLPERKSEVPTYTTKYSQVIEGLSGERTGLGFSKIDEESNEITPKKTISYGNGLMFTKGEVLNEEKSNVGLEDTIQLLEAKLKFLCEQQTYPLSPIQEMSIQLQTLLQAYRASALSATYLDTCVTSSMAALTTLEVSAAPPGWRCEFNRSAGRYAYTRDTDGHTQFDYPAESDDMDICTTPPHISNDDKAPQPSPPPPPPAAPPLPPAAAAPPPPPPPPPAWDPPPPGCDDVSPPPCITETKKEIGDELLSFYNDIAELEKETPTPTNGLSPERVIEKTEKVIINPPLPPEPPKAEKEVKPKKKSKVKISTTVGMKSKAVSSLVAKWQQVAEENDSD